MAGIKEVQLKTSIRAAQATLLTLEKGALSTGAEGAEAVQAAMNVAGAAKASDQADRIEIKEE